LFAPVETKDGSKTFYSETFGEWFHSREGACHEAQTTYVAASQLAQRAQGDRLKILDICYGLGYNSAAALETIWATNPQCFVELKALEINIEVAKSAIAQGLTQRYSRVVQGVLAAIATNQHILSEAAPIFAQMLIGDARQQIQPLIDQSWQADVIFLDPFSPPHCPQLWTVEFLQLVAACLDPEGGVLVTYSCAAAVRSALKLAELAIGSTSAGGRKWPGTVASYASDSDLSVGLPLSQQEQEHLQTRAAVPYRDATLRSNAEEILARRHREQTCSSLLPTGPWRRRWAAKS
jgi:tRNA U34 5-methylaminomethyl-2-thiouridine-forming methyltransferase MnmC